MSTPPAAVAEPDQVPRPPVPEEATLLAPAEQFPAVAARHREATVRRAGRLLVAVAVLAGLELAGFGATYLAHSRVTVSTDNARVDADRIDVNAPATGLVDRWTLGPGSPLRRGAIVGWVRGAGGPHQPMRAVRAPSAGTVGLSAVTDGTYVRQGQVLAAGFDLGTVWITARVGESDIGRVRLGAPASARLDAYPGVEVRGTVVEIGAASAASSDVYPSPDVDPTDIRRIDQYVPVRIAPYPTGVPLYPGLDATVEIGAGP